MGYETEDSMKQEMRDLLRRLRTNGCAPSDQIASEVAAGVVEVWRINRQLAEDIVEEADLAMRWPTPHQVKLMLGSARLGSRGRVALDSMWTLFVRLSQPHHQLAAEARKRSIREARALQAQISERTEQVYSGAVAAEDFVAWACSQEPTLIFWLRGPEGA